MKFLMVDNYDSFTYNLVHYFQTCGVEIEVKYNDDDTLLDLTISDYDAIVLSPGPGTPANSGYLLKVIENHLGQLPMLGVCLGMQALGEYFGWKLVHAAKPMHGKTSFISHTSKNLFENMDSPMEVGRYHSLIIKPVDAEFDLGYSYNDLYITAMCNGEVMGVENWDKKVFGVQFHPESILTPQGMQLIANFIRCVENL